MSELNIPVVPFVFKSDIHIPRRLGKFVEITVVAKETLHGKVIRRPGLPGRWLVGWRPRSKRLKYIKYYDSRM